MKHDPTPVLMKMYGILPKIVYNSIQQQQIYFIRKRTTTNLLYKEKNNNNRSRVFEKKATF